MDVKCPVGDTLVSTSRTTQRTFMRIKFFTEKDLIEGNSETVRYLDKASNFRQERVISKLIKAWHLNLGNQNNKNVKCSRYFSTVFLPHQYIISILCKIIVLQNMETNIQPNHF